MKSIKESGILNVLFKEYEIEIPSNLEDIKIYEEIENFKDAEYIYCIAYEMLIRTDEYNTILKEYEPLKNKSKDNMTDDEFLKLRKLISKMNELGIKKTSFLGFDYENEHDHVFKRINYYNEIINSPWNVKMVHKFQLDPSLGYKSIFHMLIDFYNEKNQLYVLENKVYKNINLIKQKMNKSNQINFINSIPITDVKEIIDILFIPYIINNNTRYKALKDIIYLNDLDNDFSSKLKEKQNDDLLIQAKSNFSEYNSEFWNKYYVNDIKEGLNKLVEFHIKKNLIYDQNAKHAHQSKNEILINLSNFYIPCVNRLIRPELFEWYRTNDSIIDCNFIKNLEFDGIKSITGDKGYITLKKEENIYLVQISEYISLSLLDESFLETLSYEDLKNTYINTEPIFSRPRLMFDEARLTNIPINLNLSKEDLLLYISQIKEEYDKDKNIIKTDIEYFFKITLESDTTEIPSNIKYANEKRNSKDKRFLPKKRKDFKTSFALAFYVYDLYKFFIRLFEIKKKCIRRKRNLKIKKIKKDAKKKGDIISQNTINQANESAENEIKNYEINNLITLISCQFTDLSEEQIEYYLTTMKEFIHGVNREGENNILKKQYNPEKKENPKPKYKNLIIGDSNIVRTNKSDLIKTLID